MHMAKREHYSTKFELGKYYHVYNRTVDRKPMFTLDKNYGFFLQRADFYLSPVLEVYAWCLMNNHFHLLVRILESLTFEKSTTLDDPHKIVSHCFGKLFQSYAMAFNNQENRVGSLFQNPFKRALVDNDAYFTNMVYYIHSNPQTHGFVDDFRTYPWSSYGRIIDPKPSKLKKDQVLDWFGGKDKYIDYHNEKHQQTKLNLFFDD